jgi:hypothetical protein
MWWPPTRQCTAPCETVAYVIVSVGNLLKGQLISIANKVQETFGRGETAAPKPQTLCRNGFRVAMRRECRWRSRFGKVTERSLTLMEIRFDPSPSIWHFWCRKKTPRPGRGVSVVMANCQAPRLSGDCANAAFGGSGGSVMVATDWGKRPNGEPDVRVHLVQDRERGCRARTRLLHPYPLAERLRS